MNERERRGVSTQVSSIVHGALEGGVTAQELRKSIFEQAGVDGSLRVFGLGGVGAWLEHARIFGLVVKDSNGIYTHAPVGTNRF